MDYAKDYEFLYEGLRIEGHFMVDDDENKVDLEQFSHHAAEIMLSSLKCCFHCLNCENLQFAQYEENQRY